MVNDNIAKGLYGSMCVQSRIIFLPRKRCIDTMNECLKKSLNIRQARRMVYDCSEWRRFVRENEPLNLAKYRSCVVVMAM